MDAVKQENFERILDDLTKLNRLKYQCSISTHEVIHPAILSKIEDLTKCVTSAPESITLPDVERLLKIRGSLDVISLGAMKQNGIYTTRIDPILRAKMKMLVSSIGQPSDLDPVDSLTRLREVKPPRDSIRVPYRGFAADIGQLIESKVRMVVGNVMAPPGSQRAEVQKDAAVSLEVFHA